MVTSGVDVNVQRLINATLEAFKDDKGQRSASNGASWPLDRSACEISAKRRHGNSVENLQTEIHTILTGWRIQQAPRK